MNWTQPVCINCWYEEHPDIQPTVVLRDDIQICCICGDNTEAGIYVRKNPNTVPYPRQEQTE